jgi:hypothetical protein
MNRNLIRSTMFGVLLLVGTSMATAQEFSNLGELLDKGAKRLDAAQLKTLLTGAMVSGTAMNGKSTFEMTYSSDGTANGRIYGIRVDQAPGMTGTWKVDEKGQICVDLMTMTFGAVKNCTSYYNLNNAYFSSATDDRSAVVRARAVKR